MDIKAYWLARSAGRIFILPTAQPDMEFVKNFTKARFLKTNFTQKCVNVNERKSVTKKRK